ncbi:glycosyltransferase family 2 protein [Engelhardtia mirabilis]|uniref:N-acetylglucosaminyl-diphospho-decaprenol L-rhamnosyltransferase n=1 Tax=Engelhardtia mirabilis TaxID=2528011 RepID=A0A518BI82_9BACT|nr:N-acetylglucosaminyl-diphospho-decaprenol L-rhamnosyltransferase [Planctomycetes bacterium Pla133]QDV01017.1 N-acetylglucosaminyl-diphospho-decaprenol L-rhamnosyltransferase [Planctomycetes bacterium Pla86]
MSEASAAPAPEVGVGPRHHRRLSALVVNYNTGAFAVQCVRSLLREWRDEGRRPEDLEVVVVDNASPADQSAALAELESLGVVVVAAGDNLGYAGGMNLALEHTSGGPQDMVALLNPDLFILPGAIGTMLEFLVDHADVGAVDPRATIDPGQALNLPRNALPTVAEHALMNLAQWRPWFTRAYSKRRTRAAIEWWTADGPIDADMLSGCCVMLRREVIAELPYPLLDPRYPLYFEDTDLFRTLNRLGYRNVHLGNARVLHHWSRSAGFGASFAGEPQRRQHLAQAAYFSKFYGRLGARLAAWLSKKGAQWEGAGGELHPMVDLGPCAEPPELEFGSRRRFVVEVGLSPKFLLACGVVGEGDRWRCADDTWTWWFEGAYYLRALDLDTGALIGAWRLVKTAPGRLEPMREDEWESAARTADGVSR